MEARDNSWLAAWAQSVVSCSLLPEISLRCKQRPLKENVDSTGVVRSRVWSLPVSVKAREWRKRFRGRGRRRMRRIVKQDNINRNSEGGADKEKEDRL